MALEAQISMEFEGSEAGIVKFQWNLKVLGVLAGRRRERLQGRTTARLGSNIVENVRFGPVGRASRLPALILGPQDQPRSAREDGPGRGIGCEGLGEGPRPPNLTFSITYRTKLKLDKEVGGGDFSELCTVTYLITPMVEP